MPSTVNRAVSRLPQPTRELERSASPNDHVGAPTPAPVEVREQRADIQSAAREQELVSNVSTRLDFAGIVRAEWTNFRSVRSSVAALILLVVISVGFTGMILALTVSQWDQVDDAQRQQ